jgi:tetratricopeptide (TPR) repeat protein
MGVARALATPFAVVASLLCAPLKAQDRPVETKPKRLIKKANRLAWLYNWYMASPLYAEAERLFEQAGDRRNALWAKIGRLWSEWESMSFRKVSEYLATEPGSPLAKDDSELRLWLLDAKGAVDLEVNPAAARQVYEEARDLSRQLGDKAREARASGELGIIAFMVALGKRAEAEKLFQETLELARQRKRRGLAASVLTELGKLANEAGRSKRAVEFYQEAVTLAQAGELRQLVATASFGLARIYRDAGDLEKAEESAAKGVEASQRVGETFELPERYGLVARLRSDRGLRIAPLCASCPFRNGFIPGCPGGPN